jgi:translocation and assembly module TamB
LGRLFEGSAMTVSWQKAVGWTAVTVGTVLLLLTVSTVFLLKSSAFHKYLVAKIEAAAQESTGARVEMRDLTLHVKTLTADVYGLSIHGTETAGQKPLLLVPHARIGLKIISIFHRQVNLSELLVDRPELTLAVDKQGNSNLPHPPRKSSSSNTNVFDMAIGHVLLTDGRVQLRDRELPLSFDATDLRTEIRFSAVEKKYSGTLSYTDARLQYAGLATLPSRVDARFDASPAELNLESLVFAIGESRVSLQARVRDYSNEPAASGKYDVLLHAQDFAGLSTAAQASGNIALSGTMEYRDVPGEPILRNVISAGSLNSSGLLIDSPQLDLPIARVAGNYRLSGGNLRAQGFAVDMLEGQLKADAAIENIGGAQRSQCHLAITGVSLQSLKAALRNYSRQNLPVSGTLNASADAKWDGPFSHLKANSAIVVRGEVLGAPQGKQQRFPLNASLRVNYDGVHHLITVPSSIIQLPATSITAQGEVGNHSNLSVKASTTNLAQLMVLINGLHPLKPGGTLPQVRGSATLEAGIRGTLHNPQITAQLGADQLQVNQSEWKQLRLSLSASPSRVSIQNGSLVSARRGLISFSGSAGLKGWAFASAAPLSAALHIQQLPIDDVQQLAGLKYALEGDITGDAEIRGSGLNPEGRGSLRLLKAKAYDEPIQNFSAQFTAERGAIQATLNSSIAAGSLNASLGYVPETQAYQVKLDAPGVVINKLHIVQARNIPASGTLSLTAAGAGTLTDPRLNLQLRLPQLQVRGTSASDIRADLNVANHLARITLDSGVGQAKIRGSGTVRLSPGYYAEGTLDTSKFPLDPLLAVYAPSRPAALHGESEFHVSIRGPLTDKSRMEAHLTIPTLRMDYESLNIANSAPIRADYKDSVVTLQPSGFQGTGTAIQFQGRVPLDRRQPMNVSAHGSLDTRLIQMFSTETRSQGLITLDVRGTGTESQPGVSGEIRVQNVSLSTPAAPLGVENFNATMQLTNTGVQITNAAGQAGGGQITVGGSVSYRPQLQMNLALTANNVRLRYPEGVRTVFTSSLMLSGDRQASLLQGRVLIDSLSFTSDFDAGTFMGQFTGTSSPAAPGSLTQNLKLQIAVQTTSQLNAGTSQLSLEGQANLRIIGTAADPVIVGRANLTSGDVFFNRRQFHLERGIINFANPNQTEPVLNVLITTTTNQYNLSITILGPINKLQISYVSDPPLPPADVINLIARGQTTQESAPTSFGANTILAAGLGQVGSGVSKLTGISGLQIDPLIGGNNTNPSARLGLQKRVSKNFTFTFSTDVTQPQNEIVQGEYQLNKRWSVSVVRNESGGFAVDGRFHTNF